MLLSAFLNLDQFFTLPQPEIGHSILVAVTSILNVKVRWPLYSSSTWLCLNAEEFNLVPSATTVLWELASADYLESKSSPEWLFISTQLLISKYEPINWTEMHIAACACSETQSKFYQWSVSLIVYCSHMVYCFLYSCTLCPSWFVLLPCHW